MNNLFVQELPSFSMIGGSFRELEFQIFDDITKEPVDLSTFDEIRWILFRYGDPETPLLNLSGIVSVIDTSVFTVNVLSNYSENLEGLYIHQLQLTDSLLNTFIPIQGQINILAKGKGENSLIIN